MFNHKPIKTPIIETAHFENQHFYISPEGERFPSITTILHAFPNIGIDIWKSNTPNWKEIQEESFSVGTEFHSLIESYLKNNHVQIDNKAGNLFENLKPELHKIDNIICQETRLYHPELKIAGTVDLISDFNGVLSVVDFKNSRKSKKEWMVKKSGYYLQLTAYSKMFEYCTGIKINQGVVLIANWDGSTSTYIIEIDNYVNDLESMIELYYETK